jgi:hypothetical protein
MAPGRRRVFIIVIIVVVDTGIGVKPQEGWSGDAGASIRRMAKRLRWLSLTLDPSCVLGEKRASPVGIRRQSYRSRRRNATLRSSS